MLFQSQKNKKVELINNEILFKTIYIVGRITKKYK